MPKKPEKPVAPASAVPAGSRIPSAAAYDNMDPMAQADMLIEYIFDLGGQAGAQTEWACAALAAHGICGRDVIFDARLAALSDSIFSRDDGGDAA